MPATGSVALDTNIVVALFEGEPAVVEFVASCESVVIPATVIGELYFGALKSARADANVAAIDRFIADRAVLAADARTARIYGELKLALSRKGRPIPENDIWIAALAVQNNAALVTRDAHFEHIDSVQLQRV